MENKLNARYQTLVILWLGLLMSIGIFFLVSLFAAPEFRNDPRNPPSSLPIVAFTAVGTFLVVVSFVVKRKLLERSVETQDVNLVQKTLVVTCAMCEVSAMLGLLERFTIGNREYYLLFLLAAAGTLFHFPKRSQLEAASYKSRTIVN